MPRLQVHPSLPLISLTLALLSLHNNCHLLAKLACLYIDIQYLRPPILRSHKTLFFVPKSPNSSDQAAGLRGVAIHSLRRMSAHILHLFVILGNPLRSSPFQPRCWRALYLSLMSPCLTADMSDNSTTGKPYVLFTC